MAVLLDSDNNSDSESNPLPDFSCVFDVASSKSSDRHGCLQNSREKAINLTKRKRNMVVDHERTTAKMDRKLQREADHREKRLRKDKEKASQKTEREARAEVKPGERQKQMTVMLGEDLSELLLEELGRGLVEYDIQLETARHLTSGTVRWKRAVHTRSVDQTAQILLNKEYSLEGHVLICLTAKEFVSLLLGDRELRMGRTADKSLIQFVEHLIRESYPECQLTVAVSGMEAYYRSIKTKHNRQFKQQVRDGITTGTHSQPQSVSKTDVQEGLVNVQLQTGCVVRLVEKSSHLVELIVHFTRAIADKPYKKTSLFSFHPDQATSSKKKTDQKTEASVAWQHMVMQFTNVSSQVAAAIVTEYPTPSSLYKAYQSCTNVKEAELLLQNITVRRGVGVTASSRRVGPIFSRRLHSFLTDTDGQTTLS